MEWMLYSKRKCTYHPFEFWVPGLDPFKFSNLAFVNILFQLPGTVLIGQRAPFHQVVNYRLGEKKPKPL